MGGSAKLWLQADVFGSEVAGAADELLYCGLWHGARVCGALLSDEIRAWRLLQSLCVNMRPDGNQWSALNAKKKKMKLPLFRTWGLNKKKNIPKQQEYR